MKEFKIYNFVSGCEGIANDESADQFVFFNFTGPNRVYHKSQWTRTTQHIPLPKTEPEFKEFTIYNPQTHKFALANDSIYGEYIFVRKSFPNSYYSWSDWVRTIGQQKQENKFKVGDKVIKIDGYLKGMLFKIFSIGDDCYRVYLDSIVGEHIIDQRDLMWVPKNQLELFEEPKFKVGDKVRIVNFHPDWKAEFEDEEAIFTIDHMKECGDRACLVGSDSWNKKFHRGSHRTINAPLKDLELYIAPKEVPDRSAQLKKWIEFWRIGNREFKVGDWVEIISSAIYPIGLTGKIDVVGDSTIRIDTRSPYGNLWIPMLCVKHILLRQEFEVGNCVKVVGGVSLYPPGTAADIIEVDYVNRAVRLQNILHGIYWTDMKNVEHFFKPTVKQEKPMKLEVYNKYESSKEQIVRLELLKCGEEVRIICVNSSGDTLAHLLSLTKDGVKLFDHVDKSLGFPLDSKGRLLIKS